MLAKFAQSMSVSEIGVTLLKWRKCTARVKMRQHVSRNIASSLKMSVKDVKSGEFYNKMSRMGNKTRGCDSWATECVKIVVFSRFLLHIGVSDANAPIVLQITRDMCA